MSQFKWGTIDPFNTSGEELADLLNQGELALQSLHSGVASPSYAIDGMLWWNTSANPWALNLHEGGADYPILNFDTLTNTAAFIGTTAWGLVVGDINSQLDLQAQFNTKADLSGAQFSGTVGTPNLELTSAGTANLPSIWWTGARDLGIYTTLGAIGFTNLGVTTFSIFQTGLFSFVPLDMGDNKIVNLLDPADPLDAVNFQFLQSYTAQYLLPSEVLGGNEITVIDNLNGTITISSDVVQRVQIQWLFEENQTATDPGSTYLKIDSGTLQAATFIYVSESNYRGDDVSGLLALLDQGDRLVLSDQTASKVAVYEVSGPAVDNGVWWTVPVAHVVGSGNPSQDDLIEVAWSPRSGQQDHGELAGLGDDDHTQYHNDARGDARYVNNTGDTMTDDLVLDNGLNLGAGVDFITQGVDGGVKVWASTSFPVADGSTHLEFSPINAVDPLAIGHGYRFETRSADVQNFVIFRGNGNVETTATEDPLDTQFTTKGYADGRYVDVEGDAMTGALRMNAGIIMERGDVAAFSEMLDFESNSTDAGYRVYSTSIVPPGGDVNHLIFEPINPLSSSGGSGLIFRTYYNEDPGPDSEHLITFNGNGNINLDTTFDPLPTQVTTRQYMEDHTVDIAGDTMTGDLNLDNAGASTRSPFINIVNTSGGGGYEAHTIHPGSDINTFILRPINRDSIPGQESVVSIRTQDDSGAVHNIEFGSDGNVSTNATQPPLDDQFTTKGYADANYSKLGSDGYAASVEYNLTDDLVYYEDGCSGSRVNAGNPAAGLDVVLDVAVPINYQQIIPCGTDTGIFGGDSSLLYNFVKITDTNFAVTARDAGATAGGAFAESTRIGCRVYDMTPRSFDGSDPFFANVISLLHLDDIGTPTVVTDEIGATTWANGNQVATTPKFGAGCHQSITATPKLTSANMPNIGQRDFTIECWMNSSATADRHIFDFRDSTADAGALTMGRFIGNAFTRVFLAGAEILTSTSLIWDGSWHHVAICRSGATMRLFVDGIEEDSFSDNPITNLNLGTSGFVWGNYSVAANDIPLQGLIDDGRITVAPRYVNNFPVPTEPFPNS